MHYANQQPFALLTHTANTKPAEGDGICSISDNAKPRERSMIVDIAKTIPETGA